MIKVLKKTEFTAMENENAELRARIEQLEKQVSVPLLNVKLQELRAKLPELMQMTEESLTK